MRLHLLAKCSARVTGPMMLMTCRKNPVGQVDVAGFAGSYLAKLEADVCPGHGLAETACDPPEPAA